MAQTIYCPVRNLPCPIEPKISPSMPICFIAIPSEYKDTYNTVKGIIEENGVFPYLAVEEVTAGRDILCKICEKILFSSFGVIELTEKNPNVMFEFGLTLGREKPVFILYNKTLAQKTSISLPSDISALERIEYTDQEDLRSKFSKGLKTHLEKQGLKPEIKTRPEASPEEIGTLLKAINDEDKDVRVQGLKDLLWLTHEKRIAHDPRIFRLLESKLKDPEDTFREQLLLVLDYILWYEKDSNTKTRFIETFRPIVLDIASHDSNIEIRRNAIDIFRKIGNQDVLNVLFQVVMESDDDTYRRLDNPIHSALRSLAESNYRSEIQEGMYQMLKKASASTKPRITKIFEVLRER